MSVSQWFSRPTNMACHDYCKYNPMPPGLRSLLRNGLKYCVRRPRPTNDLKRTLKRFKRDVRTKYMFKDEIEEPPGVRYIPGLYIRNDDWKPPPASAKVEKCLSNFEEELRRRQSSYKNKTTLSNLTPRQWKLSQKMLYNDNQIIV